MGGGGSPAPAFPAQAPPVPVNPFAPIANAPYQPGSAVDASYQAGGPSKNWSGVMNTPQGAPRALPNTQSFPQAPYVTGGAGMAANPFQSLIAALMTQPQPAPAPAPAPQDRVSEGSGDGGGDSGGGDGGGESEGGGKG